MKTIIDEKSAEAFGKWLSTYPKHILTIDQLLTLLLNKELFYYTDSLIEYYAKKSIAGEHYLRIFKENKSLNKLDYIQNIDFLRKMQNLLLNENKDLTKSNLWNLFYAIYYDIPIKIPSNIFFTNQFNSIRIKDWNVPPSVISSQNFEKNKTGQLSNFGLSYIKIQQFLLKNDFELKNLGGTDEVLLNYEIRTDLEKHQTADSNKIIENTKLRVRDRYNFLIDKGYKLPSLFEFAKASIPSNGEIDISPEEVFSLRDDFPYDEISRAYSKAASQIDLVNEHFGNLNKKSQRINKQFKVGRFSFNIAKYFLFFLQQEYSHAEVDGQPSIGPFEYLLNRKLLGSADWLLTINDFRTSLESTYD